MLRLIAVLRIATLPITQLISKARLIVEGMTENKDPYFPTPWVDLSLVTDKINELEQAYQDSRDSSKDATADMYVKRFELITLLEAQRSYVQYQANTNPEIGAVIILSAAMEVKSTGGSLPRTLAVVNTLIDGEVLLQTASGGRNTAYKWRYGTDRINWTEIITNGANTEISGLEPGLRHYFEVALIQDNKQGPWQGPVDIIVT